MPADAVAVSAAARVASRNLLPCLVLSLVLFCLYCPCHSCCLHCPGSRWAETFAASEHVCSVMWHQMQLAQEQQAVRGTSMHVESKA